MKISYSWLKDFITTDLPAEKTSEILTDLGLEVEGLEEVESIPGGLRGVVIGKVLTCTDHPNSDHLHITTVDLGQGQPVQIVCGAPNVKAGQTVPVATIGTKLYDKEGKEFEIKQGKIRGEVSMGMICAEDELGLGQGHDGIMVLEGSIAAGTPASKVFGVESDHVFEIGLTPNRADAMSHLGVARDLAARLNFEGIPTTFKKPDVSFFKESSGHPVNVTVKRPDLAPRYAALVIKGVTVAPSPDWLKKRLKAIGLNPINNIVDATNYVLHHMSQPLHAFDLRLVGEQVIVDTCAEGTPFVTLDGTERRLSENDLMICSATEPMCIAGVFGGFKSGIKDDTTDLFLESAYFNPVSIRRTSKRHGVNTDASFRYERGIDPHITVEALKFAATLICEVAGGQVASQITDIAAEKFEPFEVEIRYAMIDRLLGEHISQTDVKNILQYLEIGIVSEKDGKLRVKVPQYRVDLTREADLIEDILRVYGYNRIAVSAQLHTSIVEGDKFNAERITGIAADLLASVGFNEIMATSLTKGEYTSLLEDLSVENDVKMLNPLSSDLDTMRQSMLFGTLEAISRNINFKRGDLKLFEIGKTYHKYADKYEEPRHLTLSVTGKKTVENWMGTQEPTSFFYLKAVVEKIFARLGFTNLKVKPSESDMFSHGIVLMRRKTRLATLGIVKKSLLKKFDIKQDVFYADIDWDNVLNEVRLNKIEYRELPKYPSVRRDLALLLDETVQYEDLYQTAFQTEKNLLKEVNLFDIYQGDKLPAGKKSYAMSFILNDPEQTLTDTKIDAVMDKLTKAYQKQFDATLRV